MLLRDLYRWRATPRKDAREAWLSACLTELLDQDRALLAAILTKLNLAVTGPLIVEHQRRFGPLGDSQVADVFIEGDATRVIFECKDGALPDLKQMRGYSQRDGQAILVLIAGAGAIKKYASGPAWSAFRTLSWQTIFDLAEPSTQNPLVDWFRASFRELLDWAGQAPIAEVLPSQVRAMLTNWERSSLRQKDLRRAVSALQPSFMKPDAGAWEAEELSAWWAVSRATDRMEIRGLGLNAEVTPRGSLDWSLDLRPASKGPSGAALSKSGFEDLDYEKWWQIHLFRGQASGVWETELAEAIALSRVAMKSLGLRRGQAAVPGGKTPVAEVADVAGQAARTNARIWAARRSVRQALAERVNGKAGHFYATVYDGDGTASGWFWPETEEPGFFSVHLGWGEAANKARYPAVSDWWKARCDGHAAVSVRQHPESHAAIFSVDLREVPLRRACDALVEVASELVSDRRSDLFVAKR